MQRLAATLLLFALATTSLFAQLQEQDTTRSSGSNLSPKSATAVRVERGAPEVDGRLDDPVWRTAPTIDDFRQKDPDEFGEPSTRTSVAFAYDDRYLYVAATMMMETPEDVSAVMTRRDRSGATDRIIVSLDTWRDERTAYSFSVTAAGVRTDYYHRRDSEFDRDFSFDPVWTAKTEVYDDRWTAEMRIPFSQLRFNEQSEQVWGLNINRYIPHRREDIYWVVVPRNTSGWSSRMGALRGIDGISPSARLEILPYLAIDARASDEVDPDDPYRSSFDVGWRAGLDMKVGIGSNMTLDATVNPDFGQVEADPAEVNLSAFETFFDERRPFFVEGGTLYRFVGPRHYYSRRIGAPPRGRTDLSGDFSDRPDASTILGAAKLTGRLPGGTSIGTTLAVTEREEARVFDRTTETERRGTIEPTTFYGVGRVLQELGPAGSAVGGIATLVVRDIEEGSDLGLPSEAVTGGVDWTGAFDGGAYTVQGHVAFSHVTGDSGAIARIQRNPTHFYQRPDADHVEFDPSRTAISGWSASAGFYKNDGSWTWEIGGSAESPGYELNDLGSLQSADDIDLWGDIGYRDNEPGAIIRSWSTDLDLYGSWNFGGLHRSTGYNADLNITWSNWLYNYLGFGSSFAHMSDTKTRDGPLMKPPSTLFNIWTGMGNNFGAKTRWTWHVGWATYELDGWMINTNGSIAANIGDRLEVSFGPGYFRETSARQYVTRRDGGPAETFDRRYIFARLAFERLSAEIRASYAITPDLVVELYVEPFTARGEYSDFGQLAEAGTDRFTPYGEAIDRSGGSLEFTESGDTISLGDPDFSTRSFNSNLVLRFEPFAGSTLYAVWQMNRGLYRSGSEPVTLDDWVSSIGDSGDHILALKFSWWLPIGS